MFISLSRVFAKIGGFKMGLGVRITKKNAIWMSFVVCFVCMLQATWYMMVLCFWLVYAMFYGIVKGIIALVRKLRGE